MDSEKLCHRESLEKGNRHEEPVGGEAGKRREEGVERQMREKEMTCRFVRICESCRATHHSKARSASNIGLGDCNGRLVIRRSTSRHPSPFRGDHYLFSLVSTSRSGQTLHTDEKVLQS